MEEIVLCLIRAVTWNLPALRKTTENSVSVSMDRIRLEPCVSGVQVTLPNMVGGINT